MWGHFGRASAVPHRDRASKIWCSSGDNPEKRHRRCRRRRRRESNPDRPPSTATALHHLFSSPRRMAGGLVKYRHLSRDSQHRQALLRNLVTSLIKNESIHTTWPKAKEAQRLAEKLITLAKRNNETSRRQAQGILYVCISLPPPPLPVTVSDAPFRGCTDCMFVNKPDPARTPSQTLW